MKNISNQRCQLKTEVTRWREDVFNMSIFPLDTNMMMTIPSRLFDNNCVEQKNHLSINGGTGQVEIIPNVVYFSIVKN